MSNSFDFGSMPVAGGYLGFYRMVHHSRNFILRDGKLDILFSTADEAEKAAGRAFKDYLNNPIHGMNCEPTTRWDEANGVFNLEPTVRPASVKQKGRTKVIQVERRGAIA